MLRRCPDQLGPTPPEQQADRGPAAEPCGIIERSEFEARETSVYPACGCIQRADEIPDVADERGHDPEQHPEVDPDQNGRRVLEDLTRLRRRHRDSGDDAEEEPRAAAR